MPTPKSFFIQALFNLQFRRVPVHSIGAAGHENAHDPALAKIHGTLGTQRDGSGVAIQGPCRAPRRRRRVFLLEHSLHHGKKENHV